VRVADEVLAERRAKMDAAERPWQPVDRKRSVSKALLAYAALVVMRAQARAQEKKVEGRASASS